MSSKPLPVPHPLPDIIGPTGVFQVGEDLMQEVVDAAVLRQALRQIFLTTDELLTRQRGTSREVRRQLELLQVHQPEVYKRVMSS